MIAALPLDTPARRQAALAALPWEERGGYFHGELVSLLTMLDSALEFENPRRFLRQAALLARSYELDLPSLYRAVEGAADE